MRICRYLAPALLLLATSSRESFAYALKETEAGRAIRWPDGQATIRVVVDGTIEASRRAQLLEALDGAIGAWNESGPFNFLLDVDGTISVGPAVLVTWPQDQWPHDARELAVTAVRIDVKTGAILSATVRINDQYAWSTFEGEGAGDYAHDLQSVLTHELGHALGFAHSEEADATMHAGAAPGETKKRTLEADDLLAIAALYGETSGAEDAVAEVDAPFGCTSATASGDALVPLLILFGLAIVSRRKSS